MLQTNMHPRIIRKLRESLKLTQEKMAKKLGVDRTTIARWEVGLAKPRGLYLHALEQLEQGAKKKKNRGR